MVGVLALVHHPTYPIQQNLPFTTALFLVNECREFSPRLALITWKSIFVPDKAMTIIANEAMAITGNEAMTTIAMAIMGNGGTLPPTF